MAGQNNQAQYRGAGYDVGNRPEGPRPLFLLLLYNAFYDAQQQGQPGCRGDHHREYDTDDHETTELEGNAAEQGGHRPQLQYSCKQICVDAGNGQVDGAEPAIRSLDWEEVEEYAQEVGDAGLTCGKEGRAREEVGIP